MGKKQSKKRKDPILGAAELHALSVSTKMDKDEILKWHTGFMIDCPSGKISKKDLESWNSNILEIPML